MNSSFDIDSLGIDLQDLETDADVRGGHNVAGCSASTVARAYTGLAQNPAWGAKKSSVLMAKGSGKRGGKA
jgi:hypothetical protein